MTIDTFFAEEMSHNPDENPEAKTTGQGTKPTKSPDERVPEYPGQTPNTGRQASTDGYTQPMGTRVWPYPTQESWISSINTNSVSFSTGSSSDENETHFSTRPTRGYAPTTATAGTTTATGDSRDDGDGDIASDDGEGAGGPGGSGLSETNKKVAIAVPVAVVGALILGALIFFFLKRRKRNHRKNVMTGSPSQTEMNLAPASALSLPHNGSSWNPNPDSRGMSPPPPITVTPIAPGRPAGVPQVHVQDHDALAASHSRNVSSDTGRMQSRFTEHEHLEGATTGTPVVLAGGAAAAVAAGHRRSGSTERPGSSEQRPQSPFAHPLDDDADAMSDISEMSGRRSTGRDRGGVGHDHDDDVSSVSSFEDDPPPRRNS